MAEIVIYSSPFCGYCFRAKRLLDSKGVTYEDIDVMVDPSRRPEMLERSGGQSTVPQIFIDNQHVGGSDELAALESSGELDRLLGLA